MQVKLVQKYKAEVSEVHRQLSIAIKNCDIEKVWRCKEEVGA